MFADHYRSRFTQHSSRSLDDDLQLSWISLFPPALEVWGWSRMNHELQLTSKCALCAVSHRLPNSLTAIAGSAKNNQELVECVDGLLFLIQHHFLYTVCPLRISKKQQ
eukprot:s967_g4.t1